MERRKFEVRQLIKDKKFWFASFLIAWAAALQGHMMWMQRQDSFRQKFGNLDPEANSEEAAGKQEGSVQIEEFDGGFDIHSNKS